MACCSVPVPVADRPNDPIETVVPLLRRMAVDVRASAESPKGSMGELEEEIARSAREVQRLILEEACQRKCDRTPPECPRCGGALSRVTAGRERTIESRFGPIKIRRQYGWCGVCRQWFYPADIALGLEKNAGASPSVQEAAALAVSKMPVADARPVIQRLAGIDISHATLDREARRQGKKAEQLRESMDEQACDPQGRWEVTREIKPRMPGGEFTLVIQIDAWNIRERDGWGETEQAAREGRKLGRWHWVYGATVFRLCERIQKDGGRRAMILSRGYAMTRQGVDALARQTFAEAVRQGMLLAKSVLVIADGAVWIWEMVEDRFSFARQRLDFYHASQHLWAVAAELHGAGTQAARQWVEPLLHQLRHGGHPGVLQTLEELRATVESTHAKVVEREANYFQTHADRLNYQAGEQRGEPLGSGAMESACRQYQCRFKRPGQFWSTEGDEALMALETLWRNNRWHLLYPHAGHCDPARN